MFFLLSKLLEFTIDPFLWVTALFLISFFSRNDHFRKKMLGWAILLLLFFSNNFIFDECSRAWEVPATPYDSLKSYDAGIVLGGMLTFDKKIDRIQFYRGADRLLQTIELYKKGIIKKIIFTGGSGSVLMPENKEGPNVRRYLLTLGIPETDFLIEEESKNTHENALFTKALLDKNQLKGDFLLITSAFHMRRSQACFKKVGVDAESYSTDRYAGPRKFNIIHLLLPNVDAIVSFRNLIHEVIGFITYKIVGYA